MSQKEIISLLKLSDEQQAIVDEINEIFARAKKANIELIYDCTHYAFAAVNKSEVAEFCVGNVPLDAIDIEDCIEWNVDNPYITDYRSFCGNLHAVFK